MAKNKTAVATGILSDHVAFALLLMHINHSEYIYIYISYFMVYLIFSFITKIDF